MFLFQNLRYTVLSIYLQWCFNIICYDNDSNPILHYIISELGIVIYVTPFQVSHCVYHISMSIKTIICI